MARTHVPTYDGPIVATAQALNALVAEWLTQATPEYHGDDDYTDGVVEVCQWVLSAATHLSLEALRLSAQQWLIEARGDEDKASDIEDACYNEGLADTLEALLRQLVGQTEAQAS